ncbi:TonB-dependent receptor [Dysgonomonas massiliensis]|uniref:TonB-dependent receptor n=1 Tax=Dysgonomonas massiliensis TaxID=2040292 RepID=UPI001FE6CD4F|nr:TonB-dependent receptor [Dysgonomonas massiliensis]
MKQFKLNEMKYYLTILIILISYITASAQSKVSGKIIDEQSKNPIEYVNIALIQADTVFRNGTITDENGFFEFHNITPGEYSLCATFIGYEESRTLITNSDKDLDIGEIHMKAGDVKLKDVTVTGNQVIYKADRQVIVPNDNQIKASNTGLKLLENMQLPRIEIDPLTKAVKMANDKEVQLRINGVLVTKDEIAALNPNDVIRIEYHDDPGVRYNDAGAVIDFITRVRESGGNVMLNVSEGISGIDFADDNFSAKLNHKKSEFSANAYWRRRDIKWTRENVETFNYPTHTLIRTEEGQPTRYKEGYLNLSLNYTLHDADNYLFNARFRNRLEDNPYSFTDRISTITPSDGSTPLDIVDHSSWKSNSPSLDLYFQKNLKNKQLIIFNVVGTYIDSKSTRLYTEQNESVLDEIFSDIRGDKYSLIAEGIYEKELNTGKISGGVRHTQSYTNNIYKGNILADLSMNTAETYAFTEYQLRKGKFNYSLGLGMMRTYNSQAGKSNEKYIFRPKLRVTYNINDNAFIRYSGYISADAPSLSNLNDVEQEMNPLEIQRGNPNLKTITYYSNELTTGFNKGFFSAELQMQYRYERNPIMEQITFDDEENKFIHSIDNQKGFHRLSFWGSTKFKIWKDHLVLSFDPSFRRFISEGNNYTHTYNTWRVNSSLNFNYKGWMAFFQYYGRWNQLSGETVYRGERGHSLGLGYNANKWSLSLWTFNPFEKEYFQESRNRSQLTPKYSKVSSGDLGSGKLFVLNFSLNLDFGRKFKSADKRLNNDDSDAGIMK